MHLVDITIILIILLSIIIGIVRGFIREIFSLISWGVAVIVAWLYAERMSIYFQSFIEQENIQVIAAFIALFVLTLIVASLLSTVLHRLMISVGITGVDRSLGLAYGALRGIVIVAVLILVAPYLNITTQFWWEGAKLTEYFIPVTDMFSSLLPADVAKLFKPEV